MATPMLQPTIPMQPGQRYRASDLRSPLSTSELIIDRVVRDELGMLHVVLLDLEDREISLFAEQFEAAVASGYLTPEQAPIRAFA